KLAWSAHIVVSKAARSCRCSTRLAPGQSANYLGLTGLRREEPMKITAIETLHCDAGWRNYSRSEERRVGGGCRSRESTSQAEDGIRDWSVTGVQTCALPI